MEQNNCYYLQTDEIYVEELFYSKKERIIYN